jgi:hypothetical protein
MEYSTVLNHPTLDKIHLKTTNYRLSGNNQFITDMKCNAAGETMAETKYHNIQGLNLTVKPDKQGQDAAYIYFNPNKVDIGFVMQQSNQAGLDFDLLQSNVIRADIERHQQLQFNIRAYHNILLSAGSGKRENVQHNGTFRTGTQSITWQIYDKSGQANLPVKNICRAETKYLKPYYLKRAGIETYQDLMTADLMQLYIKPYQLYLSNLNRIDGNHDADKIGQDVQLLESLFKTCNRAMQTFINVKGIESAGLDYLLQIVQAADIPKQKRYNAKKYLLSLSDRLHIGMQTDMVHELLSYFGAAAVSDDGRI